MGNGSAAIGAVTIFFCLMAGAYQAGKNSGTKIKEAEIVEKGFGEYKPKPNGDVDFKWKERINEK